MRIAVGVVLGLGLGLTTAHAEPKRVATAEPPGMTAPVDDSQAVVVQPGALDRAASTDAAYDRGFFASTALSLEPGQFDMSLRSALKTGAVASIAAGLGHGVELSIDGSKIGGVGKTLGVGVKLEVARHGTWALAATGSVHSLYPTNSDESSRTYVVGMRVTTCTGSECTAQFTFGGGFGATTTPYGDVTQNLTPELDASFIIGKSWCRPLFELTILDGELGFLGLRFGGRHVAFDVGVGAIMGDSPLRQSDLLALVGLSARP